MTYNYANITPMVNKIIELVKKGGLSPNLTRRDVVVAEEANPICFASDGHPSGFIIKESSNFFNGIVSELGIPIHSERADQIAVKSVINFNDRLPVVSYIWTQNLIITYSTQYNPIDSSEVMNMAKDGAYRTGVALRNLGLVLSDRDVLDSQLYTFFLNALRWNSKIIALPRYDTEELASHLLYEHQPTIESLRYGNDCLIPLSSKFLRGEETYDITKFTSQISLENNIAKVNNVFYKFIFKADKARSTYFEPSVNREAFEHTTAIYQSNIGYHNRRLTAADRNSYRTKRGMEKTYNLLKLATDYPVMLTYLIHGDNYKA